jgi:hypothetical protein
VYAHLVALVLVFALGKRYSEPRETGCRL